MKIYSIQILMASAMVAEFAYNGPTNWFLQFAVFQLIVCIWNVVQELGFFSKSQHIVHSSTPTEQGETKL